MQEKIGILSDTLGPSCHEENNVSLEIPTHGENGEVMEVTQASFECKEMDTKLNSTEVANELETKKVSKVETAGLAQVVLEQKETNKVNVGNTDKGVPQKQNDPHGEAFEIVYNGEKHVEELACESEDIFEDVEEVITLNSLVRIGLTMGRIWRELGYLVSFKRKRKRLRYIMISRQARTQKEMKRPFLKSQKSKCEDPDSANGLS
ncbi:hypothetical protein Patl1_30148 [Pistacia atlantica]|uniref:Uncharacterized protein n=1 Tax=Pistacia atlantica TaxID=434234 RepID=A0ACC1AAN0_9ROSI|nr:hypothetical protein Patl1_30148 [Pistacia atlantica]